MPAPSLNPQRRLTEGLRRKIEVASAMAWEALIDTHVQQATQFVQLMEEHEPVQEALPRYLREMDMGDTMALAVRTRVLLRVEDEAAPRAASQAASAALAFPPAGDRQDDASWPLLRRPQQVVRDVIRRQRRNEQADRIVQLALARAEERVICTHVENAISFVALLEEQLPLDRSVQQYLRAVSLAGGRAQAVFQRTMARLTDVHLPA
jgi:hypothetical protein